MGRLGIIGTFILVAGCAAASPGPTAVPSASVTAGATATATPGTTPAPTPVAVRPGESWIVFQWSDNDRGLPLIRPDGRDVHWILSDLPGPAYHPDWSPTGERIAFELGRGDVTEIWIADADGTDPTKAVACVEDPCKWVDRPAWSPDGSRLAYVRFDEIDGTGYASIEVLDIDSGMRQVVAKPPPPIDGYSEYIFPRWSPDGSQIVFEVTHEPMPPTGPVLGSSLAVARSDGSDVDAPRNLTDPSLFAAYPDWSPDGERIVFNTYELSYFQDTTKASNLYTIRPDGTGLTQVTRFGNGDTRATQPSWTPDGRQIIFTWIGCEPSCGAAQWGQRRIGLIDVDGSNLTVLDGQPATHPRIRPFRDDPSRASTP